VVVVLAVPTGSFGKPKRGTPEAGAVPAPKLDVPKLKEKLFPAVLPFQPGADPDGLANTSAQVCAACHPTVHGAWSTSAHARGPSPALLESSVGMPGCLGCHLPLVDQQDTIWTYDPGRIDGSTGAPNPTFEATLAVEGVTCAACHVRDGAIVVATEAAAARPSPHRTVFSDKLATSEACAPCHQLSLPGAQAPLYDTFGEWKRSGFAEIGISCQGCHLQAGADGGLAADHRMASDPARAVTVLLDTPTLHAVRGGAPLPVAITLQNTGAGHAFPTGTPFRGGRLRVALEGPPGDDGAPRIAGRPTVVDLVRRLEPGPPSATLEDTRLGAGESRRVEAALALPADVPAGPWSIRVTLHETLRGVEDGPAFVDRRWNLTVD
jgi:hypothetical protein